MREINIMDWYGVDSPVETRYAMIKQAGFSGIQMCRFTDSTDEEFARRSLAAKHHSLKVENIHVPFRDVNTLWLHGPAGDDYVTLLYRCAEFCSGNEIPYMVMHLTNGYPPPEESAIGWVRIEKAVRKAAVLGVRVLVENLCYADSRVGAFFKFFDEYQPGFCYDTGHAHCYTPEYEWCGKFGRKLGSLHINDNDGTADSHSLPFDGTVDWGLLRYILYSNQVLPLSLEVNKKGYDIDEHSFLKAAYERSKRLLSEAGE